MLYLIIFIYFYLLLTARKNSPMVLNVYFGVPGSGKSTFAAFLAKKSMYPSKRRNFLTKIGQEDLADKLKLPRGENVFSNVNIKGSYYLNPKTDLGFYEVRNGRVIIDEAGLEFNSRNFKTFSDSNRTFFKMHRHEEIKVDVFSQSYDDMDKSLRILARNFYIVKPSLIPRFVVAVKINRFVGVDKNTAQIVDAYKMGLPFIDCKYCYAPSVWKMFDSYEKIPNLKKKQWKTWEEYTADGLVDGGEIQESDPEPAPEPKEKPLVQKVQRADQHEQKIIEEILEEPYEEKAVPARKRTQGKRLMK